MTNETPAWAIGRGFDTDMSSETSSAPNIRYWMKKGEERKIIFLSEGNCGFACWEHQVNLNNNWRNWFTCIEPLGMECPLCDWAAEHNGQFRRYKAMFFTIIDTTEYTDRAGNVHKNERRLMCCKKDTVEILMRQYTKRIDANEGLKGAMFDVFRPGSDKSASVGESFDFVKMVDLDSLPEKEEFNYAELLAPNPKSLTRAVKRLRGSTTFETNEVEGTDAKVDF